MNIITSRTNSNIKQAVLLRDKASARREHGYIFLEGARLCADAAVSGLDILQLFVTEQALAKYTDYLRVPLNHAEESFAIEPHVADALSDTKTPQGVFAIAKLPNETMPDWHGRYLALENIRDPGNVGTLLRTAEAFGLSAVIHSGCGDVYSPKALRAGMGAQLRLPLLHTVSLPPLLSDAAACGVTTFAAVPDFDAIPLTKAFGDIKNGALVVIGNEGNGLTSETLAACQLRVTIPMAGRAESLNAAAAGAIICWELSI